MSSRLRLLLTPRPVVTLTHKFAAQEDAVAAWQLDIGQELGTENIPLAHVVLVVEGTLRVNGRDVRKSLNFGTSPHK